MIRWQTWSRLLIVLLICAPAALRAQSAAPTEVLPFPRPVIAVSALTLDQLEDLAQAHNPILKRDLAQIEAARGNALQAGLYPNPHFDTNNPEVFAGRDSTFNVGFQ